jgi:alpha-2-macroglobulin
MMRLISALAIFAVSLVGAFGLTIARADQEYYLYGGPGGAFTPGHGVPVSYYTDEQNAAPLTVRIYRLPLDRAAQLGGSDLWSERSPSAKELQGLGFVQTLTSTRDEKNPGTRLVTIPAMPVGYYVAVANAGSAGLASVFGITTLGIVENQLRDGRSFFAIDLRTFRRHMGPTRIEIRDGSVRRQILCDATGLAQDYGAISSSNPSAIATTADGSAMVISLSRDYGSVGGDVGFIQTDRPVYRAGQTVDVRAIVRAGGIGSYVVPTGARKITVTAPDGSVVYQHDTPLSQFGTVNAAVRLPDDAQLGSYAIQVGKLEGSVLVAAYKKPEYQLDFSANQRYVVGGDRATFRLSAQYFFGRPAAGLHVHYVAYKQPEYVYWDSPYTFAERYLPIRPGRGRTQIAEGDVNTDAGGRSTFTFETNHENYSQTIQIEANGRDASGRTVTATASLYVVPASFSIGLSPAQWFAQDGQRNDIAVTAQGYDGKPRANTQVNVEIVARRWDQRSSREVQTSRETRSVRTDAGGKATLSWIPHAPGSYSFTAKSSDERGYVAEGFTYLWVIGANEEESWWFAPMEQPIIIAQKRTYAPGERPRVLITLPKRGRDALVLIATDRLVSTRVTHVTGQTIALNIDAPRDASQFTVTVELPNENGVSSANTTIRVVPAPKGLSVSIASRKAKYVPGERAEFDVRVRDANGNPVRTELGIGVVDEAIYAVQQASSVTPLDTLYGQIRYPYPSYSWFRPNRAATGMAKAGTTADVFSREAAPAPRPGGGPAIRSKFADTAYWSPSVVTNDDGTATLAFTWPDNLTTWRASGVAVTRSTDVGQTTTKTLVTKDFLVRLETPRFLRTGDRSQIIGIAHGLASNPRVVMRLDAGRLDSGARTADVSLDAYQMASASWPVVAPGVGNVTLTLSGHDGALSDAMRLPLPLLANTAAEHVRDAGRLPEDPALTVSLPIGYTAGDVHLSLAPSIVAELVQNLRLLDVYPYYCTEQTMSAALPAIFIDRVLRRAHLPQPDDISTGQIVRNAIARLGQLQHEDGSWGWWENDPGHPFMTAYALYGIAEFRKGGYPVPSGMFNRGVDSLVAQLANDNRDTLRFWGGAQPGSEWNTRAFMLFALADAAPGRVDRGILEQTRSHAGSLNPYALAVLGLAEHQLGNDRAARDLLARLDARAINDGAFTYWRGDTWHYAWEDDPIETTAYALRLEAALNPQSPRVARVINFLRAQRRGDWWYTTKDTAAAIYALTEATAPDQSEFMPDETVRVVVDGRTVRTLHITRPILDAADASVVVPAAALRDGSRIDFERSGRGTLYWSSDAVRYVPATAVRASDANESILARLFAEAPEFAIARSYRVGHDGPWRVGDEVTVDVTVTSRSDVQYVLVEDPFPAGVEHVSEQGHAENDAWSGLQLLDDRAAFFATKLYAGEPLRLEYTLRVTTPGAYTAPPPTASAMYGPPVSAVGRSVNVVVR